MRSVFYTADNHFGHARIIELARRPFSSVEEMNEVMIERWNLVVKPADLVIHLGDFAMGSIVETLPIAKHLNGEKWLILGNHDRPSPLYPHRHHKKEMWLERYREFFQDVTNEGMARIGGRPVRLHHLPRGSEDHVPEGRFKDHRPGGTEPLLHGHIHDLRRESGNQLNVGVDVWGFTPVHEDQIAEWLRGVPEWPEVSSLGGVDVVPQILM